MLLPVPPLSAESRFGFHCQIKAPSEFLSSASGSLFRLCLLVIVSLGLMSCFVFNGCCLVINTVEVKPC